MDRLTSMAVFVRAVDERSFAAAASRLAISAAMVGKHVRGLEARLGAKLLHRTTRRQSLTDLGRAYYERCKEILADVETAENGAREGGAAVRGTLHVTAPVSFGSRRLAPALVDFLRAHPQVRVELILSDRVVDLVGDEMDVAVRVGRLTDSSLLARRLAPYRLCLCASPAYLKRHRPPRTPADLAGHACLGFVVERGRDSWSLLGPRGARRVPIDVRLTINSGEALRQAALMGGGIILQPEVLVGDDLRRGRLQRVLPSYEPPAQPMHVLYMPDRTPPARVRRFVEFIVERFGPEAGTDSC